MPNGDKYDIRAHHIAFNRAEYYAVQEFPYPETGFTSEVDQAARDKLHEEEYRYTMDNDDELTDWARNNMNWEDVVIHATLVEEAAPVDFQEGWVNGESEIIIQ